MKRCWVAFLASILVLSGCGQPVDRALAPPPGASTAPASGLHARHPWTKPGVLRFASLNDPDSLSPLVSAYQVSVDLSMFWAGYLFNLSDRNVLVPELAAVEPTLANGGIAKDGRTITYRLRRGVQWQDGAPFTAGDVAFSWHAVMNPNNNVGSRQGYDVIASIDTPDRYTAVVHLKRAFAPFVNTFLTMGAVPIPVYPKHLLARYPDLNRVAYNSKPIGTGPFIVAEWHRGQMLRMTANPHYWRGRPKLSEIQYRAIPDENTLATSLRTHEIDLWYNASSTNYPIASHIEGTHVILTPFAQYSRLGFNTKRPVMSDPAVRRAIAYATDRKTLIDKITFGVNLLGEGDQPSFSWAHARGLRSIPYDPAQARAILDRAGWKLGSDGIRSKNGRRLRVEIASTTGSATAARLAVLAQSAWRDVGIDAEVKTYASALMFSSFGEGGIVQTGKYDVEFSSWVAGADPDDSALYLCSEWPPHGYNTFRYCNREVDAQEAIALGTFDRAARAKAYTRIQHIVTAELPEFTMWFSRRFDIANDDLQGYAPASAVTTFWNTWNYAI
ncbi:ABC transporter substrate-binding protein [Vulcanimicrobium alpinum]|uniref:ABC transporter substrate-binding protein n=1 Tax=Vulcanimicrobium alpinum TaxID=3016050 RepID=A0AAN1XSJ3_UNVUL|nr:peptide ABC transporter substrate-binding protein [Vulcanimicrobium alpinum]BDE05042.1 ABC transporter substrate-binding protein [Vulcanimicrobium alpinum]